MYKRVLAFLLAALLLTSPVTALAADGAQESSAGPAAQSAGESAQSEDGTQNPGSTGENPTNPGGEDPTNPGGEDPTNPGEEDPAPPKEPEITLGEADANGVPVSVEAVLPEGITFPAEKTITAEGAAVTMKVRWDSADALIMSSVELGEGFDGHLTIPEGVTAFTWTETEILFPGESYERPVQVTKNSLQDIASKITGLYFPSTMSEWPARFSMTALKEMEINSEAFLSRWSASGSSYKNLDKIVLGNKITAIKTGTFPRLDVEDLFGDVEIIVNLTTVDVGSSVTTIEDKAFDSNSTITTLILGSSVSSFGEETIFNCKNLKNIQVAEDNKNFRVEEGKLYDKDGELLYPIVVPNYDNDPQYMPDPADPNRVPKKIAPCPPRAL